MSIRALVTAGFGNGTFNGTIGEIVTRGYGISTIIPPTIPTADGLTVNGAFGDGVIKDGAFGTGAAVTSGFGSGVVVKGNL